METIYKIKGMTCAGCAKTVTEKLESVLGIQSIEISLENEEVKVTGYPLTFLLKRALRGTKFEISRSH
ncbi:heavy-metal-associated domain-containing protein [Streptococcus castoreus]|uniref:heavy-metal-associated domain-containing protein n=1 Tax=Streptococcus castoreus TaxID=254786 RepID=UPI00040AB45D|nr:heavy metal-associated domain-containing protein [Streptococcus castoreus]